MTSYRVQKTQVFKKTQPGGYFGFYWVFCGFFFISMCSVLKNLAEKWKLNLLTDWLTSFKICSRFYFANSVLVELKALNIIKSLVISSTRNETRLNLGWVFFARFFRWLPGFLNADLLVYSKICQFLSASLYFSKRGAYWDRLCRDVVGCHARALWPNGAS